MNDIFTKAYLNIISEQSQVPEVISSLTSSQSIEDLIASNFGMEEYGVKGPFCMKFDGMEEWLPSKFPGRITADQSKCRVIVDDVVTNYDDPVKYDTLEEFLKAEWKYSKAKIRARDFVIKAVVCFSPDMSAVTILTDEEVQRFSDLFKKGLLHNLNNAIKGLREEVYYEMDEQNQDF